MFRNFLVVSIRNLLRHPAYSFINIGGLSIGLACAFVIGLWVHKEFSHDRQWKDNDRLFRIGVNFFNIGDMAIGPEVLPDALRGFSEVANVSSLNKIWGGTTILVDDKEIEITEFFETDEEYFQLFSYQFLHGSAENALIAPNQAVITRNAAEKIFGTSDVLEKSFYYDQALYTITGVVKNETNSHINGEVWVTAKAVKVDVNWTSAGSYVYVKMTSGKSRELLETILDKILKENVFPKLSVGDTFDDWKSSGIYKFLPMEVSAIHLYSKHKYELSEGGDIRTVKIFGLVGLLILLLACVNFVNITTARATIRAREVGIRKSLGTASGTVVIQFVLESLVTFLAATIIGLGLAEIFLNVFERLLNIELLDTVFTGFLSLIVIISLSILTGALSGLFPALYISRFKPVSVLKGNPIINEKGILRSGLVIFQFVISISLLISALVIMKQLKFMDNKDMGFERENVIVIRNYELPKAKQEVFKQEIQRLPQVVEVSKMLRVPASATSAVTSINKDGEEEGEVWAQVFSGDDDMISVLGFRLLEGRNFSDELITDSSSLILNETAVRELGLEVPIGSTLNGDLKVIGVVSDFNYETLKNKIGPAVLRPDNDQNHATVIRFNGTNTKSLIEEISLTWSEITGEEKLNYYFLDENFGKLMMKEQALAKSTKAFTLLAMVISCLGLYGLSAFKAERNIKQIGIRKVLGASVFNITKRLSTRFALPILYSFLIAVPITYYMITKWLADFAYRVEIDPFLFLLGGSVAFVIGVLTISIETLRAALSNPVNCLRDE